MTNRWGAYRELMITATDEEILHHKYLKRYLCHQMIPCGELLDEFTLDVYARMMIDLITDARVELNENDLH